MGDILDQFRNYDYRAKEKLTWATTPAGIAAKTSKGTYVISGGKLYHNGSFVLGNKTVNALKSAARKHYNDQE